MQNIIKHSLLSFLFFIFLSGFTNPLPPSAMNEELLEGYTGRVINVLPADSYIILEVETADKKTLWIAGPNSDINKGDKIATGLAAEMRDFWSKSQERKFEQIFFVGKITVVEKAQITEEDKAAEIAKEEEKKKKIMSSPAERYSLKEVFTKRKELKDRKIIVRGRVVKSSGFILGKNWYHLQDGTEYGPHNADLIVTSDRELEMGNVVEATGILALDRDLGKGYFFKTLLEDAEIKVIFKESGDTPANH